MEISEQDLRAMVRDAIARHGGQPSAAASPLATVPHDPLRVHASHGRLTFLTSGDSEGQCLIEPSVRCNHCGYCQSMGH